MTASAFAQAQFRDEKTGKVWTPDNVSKDNQLRPSNEPSTPADRAFDPKAQIATATGVVVQRPNATLMGVVPITAGPTVPIVAIDSPTLQAVPGDRWVAPLYLTNNSGADANAQIGCTFTNGSRPVQETRIIAPTAGPGSAAGVRRLRATGRRLRRSRALPRAHALIVASSRTAETGRLSGPFLFG